MRKVLKVMHTLTSCGLIGGLGCYMILLVFAPQDTPVAYAEMRQTIAAISNYVLVPSLAIVLVSGLLAMIVHQPFLDKGWVLIKAAMGLLMFKGVLAIVGSLADYAAIVSRKIANGEAAETVLDAAISHEWATLWVVMALSIANVVLGVWRPRFTRRSQVPARPARRPDTGEGAAAGGERTLSA